LFAYPDGLPGGWSSANKVHFVAHSQGVQTCRYLQHLMATDYFSRDPVKIDKSNYFASLTAINGVLNGGPGPYCLDLSPTTLKIEAYGAEGATWLSHYTIKLFKLIIIIQNLGCASLTMDRIQENIQKTVPLKYKEQVDTILQLNKQGRLILMDVNAEVLDLNRRKNESLPTYVKRVW
jgi:hypothetical protein